MKNYFTGLDDQLGMLETRIDMEVDLENDPQGHVKMSDDLIRKVEDTGVLF